MSRQPGRRYFPVGDTHISRDFFHRGPIPAGYDVYIEIRDLFSERDNYTWGSGHHKVVVKGPQPRPRSKTFIGETAWSQAECYAGDCVQAIQTGNMRFAR